MTDQPAPARGPTDSLGAAPAHGATVAHIVQRLREDIFGQRLTPGARLVESELTLRFDVSRGPVREALRRLAAEGLIEHFPHRGALVRRLSLIEMRELFQIRIELEALAARLAAETDDDGRRTAFRKAIEPIFDDSPRQSCEYMAENAAFHDAILTLAGNRQLHDLVIRLQLPLIMAQVGDALTPTILESSVREHRAIANAILQRDPKGAASALRAHLERAAALALAQREN